jgi:GntR family transcriptional regulator
MDALAASEGLRRIIQEGGGTADNKLLHFEQSHASAKVAHRLKLKEGDDIVTLRRLWTANGLPVCIETSYLPLALVPDLAAQDLMSGQSLYDLLHTRYGIGRMHGEREIGVVACTEMEARLLNLEPGTSCLLLQAQAYEDDGRPVEFMRSVNHPSLVVFKTGQATVSSPKEG